MHELGLMTGVVDAVCEAARNAGATRVYEVHLSIGEMTEAIPDALEFAFEVLSGQEPLLEGAQLFIKEVSPRSVCHACGEEFSHDRFHRTCPSCGSLQTELIAGRDLTIDSIEAEVPDDERSV